MAVSQSFENAYSSVCDCGGENLTWEWDDEDLAFRAACSCMKGYTLTPVNGIVDVVDATTEDATAEVDDS